MKNVAYWFALPLILLIVWLLLNESLSTGYIVLGAILSLLLAWAAMALRPLRSEPKRPLVILRLLARGAKDIIKSNFEVARLIWLGPSSHTPGFLRIPLQMRDPHGLAVLACFITYTPGTVWAGYSQTDNVLTLHVLDLKDEAEWIRLIQEDYERLLMEIFE